MNRNLLKEILRTHSPDGAFAYPTRSTTHSPPPIAEANESICTLLGYTPDQILKLRPSDIIFDFAGESGAVGQFDTCGKPTEGTLTAHNGTNLPVEIRSSVINLDDSEFNVVCVRDITRRLRSRHNLAQGEQRFRVLYELSKMIDEAENDILNYALEQSLGMTDSKVGFINYVSPDEKQMTMQAWSKSALEECAIEDFTATHQINDAGLSGESAFQRKPVIINDFDNHPRRKGYPKGHVPIKRHLNLPVFDNGRLVLIAGVANKEEDYDDTDVVPLTLLMEGVWRIIQRKRMENDIFTAMKDAEKANKAKSQFLANMSHELRTPLNGIMGMTQLLLGTDVSAEQKEYLTLSMEASLHLSRVMTSLLDLASIETGAISLNSVNFHLPDVLNSLIKPLALQAKDKSISLVHTIGPNVPEEINGDVDKLRQILINLIYNAIKFTEVGEVALHVTRTATTTGLLGDMAELCFTVTDTGIGIPEEKQEAVFESFILGEDYLTKRYGGTGLGLSISRELASIMGGKITLKSTPGKGSAFSLVLPFLLRESKGGSCHIANTSVGVGLGPFDILVAEDEQVNALVTSGILKKKGHTVTVVGNGQHAIDTLMNRPFDLVLMDVQMPVVNGLEVTEIIRRGAAENVAKDLPIIGLTAYATDEDRKRCLDAGMNFVLTKPFEAGDLLEVICNTMVGNNPVI